jgi:hypothetical protein
MSEFNAYLKKLRAALDVSPQRADEIVAEARTHLEAKAAELEASGLNHGEAVQEAMASFGKAREMAEQLTQANGGGRTYWALRVALGVAVMLVGLFAAAAAQNPSGTLLHSEEWLATRLLGNPSAHYGVTFQLPLSLLLMIPLAVLSGAIAAAGRPYSLAAALPAVALGTVGLIADSQEPMIPLAPVLFAVVLVLWYFASLGARAAGSRSLRRRLLVPCAVLSLGAGIVAIPELANGSVFAGALGLEAAFALLLLIARTRKPLEAARFARVTAACFGAMCFGVLGLCALALVTIWPLVGADSLEGRVLLAWAVLTTALPLGIAVAAAHEWGRTRQVVSA